MSISCLDSPFHSISMKNVILFFVPKTCFYISLKNNVWFTHLQNAVIFFLKSSLLFLVQQSKMQLYLDSLKIKSHDFEILMGFIMLTRALCLGIALNSTKKEKSVHSLRNIVKMIFFFLIYIFLINCSSG